MICNCSLNLHCFRPHELIVIQLLVIFLCILAKCCIILLTEYIYLIIIKFPYNARSNWLKQRALSENRARVDDGKLAS